ncbi:helix-turn-helix transcriptional regulator [Streptomyces jumonjinensis]|uniref:helix-turn-helix transcriptional regulator n=1 Tax=Streptomyces jumonjinensis TaxID=1945 RepID=UPI0037954148
MGAVPFEVDRLARALHEAVSQGVAPDEVGAGVSAVISRVVPHDALNLVGTNPLIGLGAGSFSFWHACAPDLVGAMVRNRFRGTGSNPRWATAVAPLSVPACVVGESADEEADTTAHERVPKAEVQLLSTFGVNSELRLLLRNRRGVWGALGLFRSEGAAPFGRRDAERIAELAPALMGAVVRYATEGRLLPSAPALPAGMIIMGPDHRIKEFTPQAQAWMDCFSAHGGRAIPVWGVDAFYISLSLSARRHARLGLGPVPPVCLPPVVCGRWVAVQAQPLSADGAGDVALIVQAAPGDLSLAPFCEWYGITPRERQVVDELRTGAASKQIARRLGLSPHTVNDHLKAVFGKTGAAGRDELIAALTN